MWKRRRCLGMVSELPHHYLLVAPPPELLTYKISNTGGGVTVGHLMYHTNVSRDTTSYRVRLGLRGLRNSDQ